MKKKIIKVATLILIPNLIGTFLFLLFEKIVLWELATFLFAVIILLVWIGKFNKEDKLNMRKYGSTRIDKSTPEFLAFRFSQRVLLFSAAINIIISYVVFIFLGGQS